MSAKAKEIGSIDMKIIVVLQRTWAEKIHTYETPCRYLIPTPNAPASDLRLEYFEMVCNSLLYHAVVESHVPLLMSASTTLENCISCTPQDSSVGVAL
eukprot:SAG31_NODE_6985_length_1826_cov_2.192820_1_plen_97_part_10